MKIEIYGYGGELVIGSIPKEKYVYWKLREEEELSDHVLGNLDDEELGVTEGMELGEWYDLDNIEHMHGVSYDSGHVYVTDDEGNEIFSKTFSEIEDLPTCENVMSWEYGFDTDETEHKYVFMAYSAEKGTFSALNVPGDVFDPSKLKITIREAEGFQLIDGFWYEHPDTVDAEDLNTDGKSWECWLISTVSDDETVDEDE